MSLADELLADLEEGGEDDVDDLNDEDDDEVEDVVEDIEECMDLDVKAESVKSIAKLRDSKHLAVIMKDIQKYLDKPIRNDVTGPVETDPEYKLIVEANNITVEIDNEISIIHKFVRDKYAKRFPELESLVPVSLEYMQTVKELGNELEKAKGSEMLQEILTSATIMVVSVSASTTQGTSLTDSELFRVVEACDMALDLNNNKSKILEYVESRMSFIAPNISIIVGSPTAAKLMGIAGGLSNLSKIPACNVMILGSTKKTLAGFSSTAIMPHTGYIYYSPIVQDCPPDFRKKAARLVSAKVALASRVDACHESPSGTAGMNFKEDILKKLDKLLEPPPVKTVKALPKPIEVSGKKRGGRRVRKMKERYGITEMRKAQNRMTFAEIEEDAYQDDLGMSLGQLGKAGKGRIRGPQANEKTNVKMSKTLQKQLQKANAHSGGRTVFGAHGGKSTVRGQVAGTASSIAFSTLQGLEIVNPNAAEKRVDEANAKYFSATSGFLSVKKKTT